MNRININSQQKYKYALIQFTCSECNLGDNFFIEFDGISKAKPGNCEHFDIKFLFSSEKNSMRFVSSFNCKFCQKNDMIPIFNEKSKDSSGSITHKCTGCKRGNVTIGYLFTNEQFNIDYLTLESNIPNKSSNNKEKEKKEQNKIKIEEKINLIFIHEGKEYKIKVSKDMTIPLAFRKLSDDNKNKHLIDLDIKHFQKNENNLNQFKTIKQLNLNDGDKITLFLRAKQGW